MLLVRNESIYFFLFSLIPPDSEVPPHKPSDISGTSDRHYMHAEHAMNPSTSNSFL